MQDNPITVGQTLQRAIDRIMQQPKTADNIYDDSAAVFADCRCKRRAVAGQSAADL